MKKFLIAATICLIILGGQSEIEAATVENLNNSGIETQNMSAWPKIRDSLLGRDKHDRRYRNERNYGSRHHYGPPPPPPPRHHYGPPPRR